MSRLVQVPKVPIGPVTVVLKVEEELDKKPSTADKLLDQVLSHDLGLNFFWLNICPWLLTTVHKM